MPLKRAKAPKDARQTRFLALYLCLIRPDRDDDFTGDGKGATGKMPLLQFQAAAAKSWGEGKNEAEDAACFGTHFAEDEALQDAN